MFAHMIKSVNMRERNDRTETSRCGLPQFGHFCHTPRRDLIDIDGRRGRELSQWRNEVDES